MDMLDVISHKEFGPDYHKLSTKQKKEVHKLAIKGKLIKQSPFKESVIDETTLFGDFLLEGGLPQNWMAGRVSDYHTKLRGKRKDYDDTNFAKMNTGQPDIEDEELDSDNEVVNEKFDNTKHLSLLNKALRAIPGSKKQKDIIKQLNVVRKSGGMKPLKETAIEEYGQRLDLSYILDDESVLDGTPEEKDAINRESAKKKTEKNYKDWKSTNESLNEANSKYPNFDLNKNIRYQDTVITKGTWRYTGRESGGAGVYRNLNNNQFLGFASDDFKYFKKHLKRHFDIDESVIGETAKRDYKDEYKKFQSSTKSKKYRAELNKYNRKKGTYGNGDGKDASHKGGKIVGFESASKNRGRKQKSRLKKK